VLLVVSLKDIGSRRRHDRLDPPCFAQQAVMDAIELPQRQSGLIALMKSTT
jgi:hypothetical protein